MTYEMLQGDLGQAEGIDIAKRYTYRCPFCGKDYKASPADIYHTIAAIDVLPCGCLPDAHTYQAAMQYERQRLLHLISRCYSWQIKNHSGIQHTYNGLVDALLEVNTKIMLGNAQAWRNGKGHLWLR